MTKNFGSYTSNYLKRSETWRREGANVLINPLKHRPKIREDLNHQNRKLFESKRIEGNMTTTIEEKTTDHYKLQFQENITSTFSPTIISEHSSCGNKKTIKNANVEHRTNGYLLDTRRAC